MLFSTRDIGSCHSKVATNLTETQSYAQPVGQSSILGFSRMSRAHAYHRTEGKVKTATNLGLRCSCPAIVGSIQLCVHVHCADAKLPTVPICYVAVYGSLFRFRYRDGSLVSTGTSYKLLNASS